MDSDATVVMQQNPLLAGLRIPGETFRMPSQGLFYTNGELSNDVVNGEVEVYPLTAMEEVILSTPDKLLSGRAITEIFTRCIPQILKPRDLLSRDVDFLMVCLRMVTFGQFMEVSFEHDCEQAKPHNYMIDLQRMIAETRAIDATKLKDEYTHIMPNGQVVKLKPLTYGDIITMFQNTAMTKTEGVSEEESTALVVDTLVGVIQSVDDVVDRELIREWVTRLSLGWKRGIEKTAQSVSQWGTEFSSTHTCQDCGSEMRIHVSANPVNFFM